LQTDLSRLPEVASDISWSGFTIADNAQSLSAFMDRVRADPEQTRVHEVQSSATRHISDNLREVSQSVQRIGQNARRF
jgi:coenzyme F420-reducing hydrogenase delta subunit